MKFPLYVLLCIVTLVSFSSAQTNPTPHVLSGGNYTFTSWDASSPAGSYPLNMRFHRGPSQDPGLTAEPNADYTGAYNGTSGSRMNGLGADGFSWRNIGTEGNLGAAVLALNTTGLSNIYVSWTGGTVAIDATTREYRIRLQYRVGTGGSFADVPGPIEYTSTAPAGHSQDFGPTLLPAAVNNQPVVQLRWKYYYVTGGNTRPQLRVDNILVQSGQLPGDGTGSAAVVPDTLNGGTTGSMQVIYRRNTQVTVNGLRIVIPPAFSWSRNRTDVSFTNMTAVDTVIGDTISFSNVIFSADSVVVTISNVTSPESTAIYPFVVQSREFAFATVNPIPRVVVFGLPMPIAEMKVNDSLGVPLNINQLITVRGVVTVANEFGGPSYIQDNSGGMAIFGSQFSTAVGIGDEVIVSGIVQPFSGLFEIVNPRLHSIVSIGNVVTPVPVTASQIANDGIGGVEEYEGRLVRVNAATVTGSGVWGANTNYPLIDPTGTTEIRIDNNTNIVGTPIPGGVFDVIGVVGQFKQTPPFIGGYQLMPRFTSDILFTGPIIATFPVETNIQPNSLTVQWETSYNGSSYVRYGLTPSFELGITGTSTPTTNHSVQITSLLPASVYYIQAFSVSGQDTSTATTLIASTASPAQSTGEINAYFSKSANTSLAWFQPANQNQNLAQRLITRINNARRSIDAALYSLSGTPGNDIASALVGAKNRGVRVRVVCEDDTRNSAAYNFIVANGIPLITDRFDPINNGFGLHHNKFFVFDGRSGAAESVWVWTGSWNPTDPGTNADFQNAIEFQDQAMANAFTMEFNEMWGSDTEVPNAAASRFGARKLDNTPHRFVVGGKAVEVYFSPSDRTTSKIIREISNAQYSVGFQLLLITRNDLATALVNRKLAGKKVRGNLDSDSDTGSQFGFLQANGIDVRLKTGVSGLLHHKYAIIDAEDPNWNAITVTGSHNWSNSAENSNNENTVIVRDGNITNQYLQEFAARYLQFGGTDTIRVSVQGSGSTIPATFSLDQNYPNPFNPATTIKFGIPTFSFVTLKVYDLLGKEVATLVHEPLNAGGYTVEFNAGGLASGVYFYRIQSGSFSATKKLMLVR